MIVQYITAALAHARFEEIEDEEPWYGEIPELQGVWASGRTEEECRSRLAETLDGWLLVRLRRGLAHGCGCQWLIACTHSHGRTSPGLSPCSGPICPAIHRYMMQALNINYR